jgi:hypothetical protein
MKRIFLWAGLTGLLLGCVAIIMGFFLQHQTTELIHDGVAGQAVVESKKSFTTGSPPIDNYRIFLKLSPEQKQTLTWNPLKEDWERYQKGDVLNVFYSTTNPTNFVVGSKDQASVLHQRGNIAIKVGSLLAGLSLIIVIFSLLMAKTDLQ